MNNMVSYTYTVLRYVHDTTTGEFVNMGVALYAPDNKFVGALCRKKFKRVSDLFLDINREFLKKIMNDVERYFYDINKQFTSITIDHEKTIYDFSKKIISIDDSSLQWSAIGTGITDDPEKTLKKLFERLVAKYDEKNEKDRKNDEDIWRVFKNTIEACRVIDNLTSKNISNNDDNVEFKHAWKNGVWHCLEAVSFDLSHAETIKDKAYKWFGKISNISDAPEAFKVYFLVAKPEKKELIDPFYSAIKVLKKLTVPHEIIYEDKYKDFAEKLAKQISEHEPCH